MAGKQPKDPPRCELSRCWTGGAGRGWVPPCGRLRCRCGRGALMLVPVVFLMLPVVVLFALYPGLFTLSRLAR